jgi:hypothetical protein
VSGARCPTTVWAARILAVPLLALTLAALSMPAISAATTSHSTFVHAYDRGVALLRARSVPPPITELTIAPKSKAAGQAVRSLRHFLAAEEFPGAEAASKIPSRWGPGGPARSGGGWRWSDPANPSGNGVRIDPGDPNSSLPEGRVPHVHVRSGGEVLGPDGEPVPSGRAGDPRAHIPYSTWRNWSSWNSP